MRTLVALAVLLASVAPVGAACRTVTLPNSNDSGGAVHLQPGENYIINGYTAPPGAASVGLEFWMHAFPAGVPQNSQYLLVYLNDAHHGARRIFHAQNTGPEFDTGLPVNFPLSTFVNPGEWFTVNWLNNAGRPVDGYLIVTLRECF